MANLERLKEELDDDPLGRGYSGMTDEEAADSLNAVNRSVAPPAISTEVFLRGLVKSEWDTLSTADHLYISMIMGREVIDIRAGTETRNALVALFPPGSSTRDNLLSLAMVEVSRADELGLGRIYAGTVAQARAL